MIPLMSINFLLLFDNLNSATPCKTKTRHNAWTAHKRREIMQGTWYSIALFISDDSVFYLFYLFVSLTRTIRNGRQFPRPPASLFHADGGKYTEIVHVMQQIKGDKIWIFMGYRVPVLMRSIFSHDATTWTFPHLSPKKRHSKVCKTIWILSDDKEGTCGFMKSKLCRTRAREEFWGSARYLDNLETR